MNIDRWLELGLPRQAFNDLTWWRSPRRLYDSYTFSVKRRIWGQYWTLIAKPGARHLEDEYEIIHYRNEKKAEDVLLLMALEGLRVEKYNNE